MPRTKKEQTLSSLEKDYIKLYLSDMQRNKGKITPEDFDQLAEKLDKSVETVTRFANQQSEIVVEPEKPKSEKIKLSPLQETLRNQMNSSTNSGRPGITVMSEASSSLITEMDKAPKNRSGRYEKHIYRGNK